MYYVLTEFDERGDGNVTCETSEKWRAMQERKHIHTIEYASKNYHPKYLEQFTVPSSVIDEYNSPDEVGETEPLNSWQWY